MGWVGAGYGVSVGQSRCSWGGDIGAGIRRRGPRADGREGERFRPRETQMQGRRGGSMLGLWGWVKRWGRRADEAGEVTRPECAEPWGRVFHPVKRKPAGTLSWPWVNRFPSLGFSYHYLWAGWVRLSYLWGPLGPDVSWTFEQRQWGAPGSPKNTLDPQFCHVGELLGMWVQILTLCNFEQAA